ncbi:GAF domain-containing sensor histidine kinase [Gloeothece verrucosa]|uniref:histidine kinase n=1 Tax=Gloeothece verrucosa (strain PCC 7822) TaxID=497965 RepID=E0UDG1_GLOV7|nr:GAF domain-containing sensor histidine kinase [Gloeothece verrucosa]ADN14152.1 GAF sensor signal transduction histidine kinase [Gloeothece verrucosa PCC 7822]
MINLNQIQKYKSCATTMEYNPDSNSPVPQLIRLIQTNPDPQLMLTGIATILGEYFQGDICLIVADPSSAAISPGFWAKDISQYEISKQLLLHPLIKTMVIETDPLVIADVQADHQASQIKELAQLLPLKALLGVATHFGQEINGLILLAKQDPHAWTQEEQGLLKYSSSLVAIANSMIYQKAEISSSREQFSDPNPNTILPFSSGSRALTGDNLFKKWYQLTRQQLEQQRHLNELKDEIITTISHEAGTPLATMKLAIEMLSNCQDRLSPQSVERNWNILKQEWQRLYDLINNIKTLQQLKSTELSVQRQQVDLGFIFKEIVPLFQQQWQQDKRKRLNLVTEGLLSPELDGNADSSLIFYTDPQHFRSIILELLTNAGKFSQPQTTVSIEVSQQEKLKQKNLVITISNIGLGISPEEQQYIFEPFRRGQGMTDKAIAGTGLGLTLVKGLVELLGGTIEVASNPINEENLYVTSFIISLPHTQS